MPKSTPIQTNFTTGEISPLMMARVDFEKYYNACKTLKNMYVLPQGGVNRRPGTQYITSAKNADKISILVPFIFSTTQAYILEFGHQYIRVFKNRGQVVSGTEKVTNGTFNSGITGWTARNSGTGYGIAWDSGAQAMYIYNVYSSDYARAYQAISLTAGSYSLNYSIPYADRGMSTNHICRLGSSLGASDIYYRNSTNNPESTINITIPTTSTYYLEFEASNGASWGIDNVTLIDNSTPVEVSTTYTEAELRSLQFCQSADELYIVHPNHAPAKLTRSSHISWTLANISFTNAPSDWTTANYPGSISFFEQRLCFSGVPSAPRNIYCSESGNFFTFTAGTVDTSPITVKTTDNEVNAIRWLYPRGALLTGTSSGIGMFGSNTQYDALTPTNVKYSNSSSDRAGTLVPKRMGANIVGTSYYNKHLVSIGTDANGNIATENLMLLAEHLVSNKNIIDYAYMQTPYPMMWCVLSDGIMLSLTYMPTQSIFAWAWHETDGAFESVSVIPSSESSPDDEVWCVVNRTINGSTKRYVELMTPQFDINNNYALEDMVFLDSCLIATFSSPVTTLSGLSHLESESVHVLADGVYQGPFTVSSGAITLTTAASKVIVGLSNTPLIDAINYNGGSALGTSEGRLKTISEVSLRLYRTAEFSMGTSTTTYTQRAGNTLYTGLHRFADFPSEWADETNIRITQTKPYPLTVLSIIPTMNTNER